MHTAADVTQLIGNTPLLHLKRASEQTGCNILGKAEFLNPGGSVKDRTALGIIRAAEAAGARLDLHRILKLLFWVGTWMPGPRGTSSVAVW